MFMQRKKSSLITKYGVSIVLMCTCKIFHLTMVKHNKKGTLGLRLILELMSVIPASESQNY